MIDGVEGKILKKYRKRRVVDEEDRFYLERMGITALVSYAPDGRTAKTTNLGMSSAYVSLLEWFKEDIKKIKSKYFSR